jgi:hypothetical protein
LAPHVPCISGESDPSLAPPGKELAVLANLFNLAMLVVAYAMIVVPVLWLARPVRMVNPY